ncbi:hypothetical protein MXB_617 [Myxobolus squamalis]|nr:hypothetical protein MXB_617 [Myxobolus squamalis]
MEYSDTVVSCLGNQSYPFAAKKSNIDAPALIAKAVSQSPHIKNFVHISCMSQNQKNVDIISQTKQVGEKIVRQICPDVVVVRPSSMVGRPDHFAVYVMRIRHFLP